MLESLSIQSLGVIDSASLELGPGFSVVTGETGAGKTMVVTALGLLLGARADASSIRSGARTARVEGRVGVEPGSSVALRADEAGAEVDDGTLILARTLTGEGRSRAHAGGAGVPASLLSELADDLVAIHGQSDQQRLLQPRRQRECLDAAGGEELAEAKAAYQGAFDALAEVAGRLDDVVTRSRERAQEADLLRFGLAEVEAVEPLPGEDTALVAEETRLGHVEALRTSADAARRALSGDEALAETPDALTLVAEARRGLEQVQEHDPQLAALAEQLASASYALADVAADIAGYVAGLETDPARLGVVQERRAALGTLLRKYGATVDEVLEWQRTAAERLTELDDDDSAIAALRARHAELTDDVQRLGGRLSELRAAAAADLSERVTAELAALAMPSARFAVQLDALAQPARDGLDEVAFMFTAHDGSDPRPLQRGASGGELSRVMLAIEVCLADSQPVPTMIFDEVDAGVGGKAAVEIGRRLARLARRTQVVVVTHLPQVAAFADHHYAVVKTSDGSVTTSGVTELDDAGRRRELSRMLAGLEDSDSGLAHADELVALADEERAR